MSNKPLSYEQLRKHQYVLVILVLALAVLVVGLFVELVQSRHTSIVDPKLRLLAKPLNPTFRYEVFDKLIQYQYLSPDQVRQQIEVLPVRMLDKESGNIVILDELQSGSLLEATPEAEVILPADSDLQLIEEGSAFPSQQSGETLPTEQDAGDLPADVPAQPSENLDEVSSESDPASLGDQI